MGKTKVWWLGIHAEVVKLLRTKRKYYHKSQDSGYYRVSDRVGGEFGGAGGIFFLPWMVVEYLIWIVSLYFRHFMYTLDF